MEKQNKKAAAERKYGAPKPKKQANDDIVLLSQRYNSDRIVGEVLNNGRETARFVKVSVSFYGGNGQFLGVQMGYADPHTINPGDRAPFNVLITSDAIKDNTETYELTFHWKDADFTSHSYRIA